MLEQSLNFIKPAFYKSRIDAHPGGWEPLIGRLTNRGEGAHKNQTSMVVMVRSVMAAEASQTITTD